MPVCRLNGALLNTLRVLHLVESLSKVRSSLTLGIRTGVGSYDFL